MSRRESPGVQVIAVVIVVLIFLYGFYVHHKQHTRLRHLEETGDNYKQKVESLSAQLTVLYEHKTRLESSVEKEKELHKETRDDLELELKKLRNEQTRLTQEKDSVSSDLQSVRLQLEKADVDIKRLQQQNENDVATLRDELADCKRRYEECKTKQPPSIQPVPGALQQNVAMPGNSALQQNLPDSNVVLQVQQPGDLHHPLKELPQKDVEPIVNEAGQKIPASGVPNNVAANQPDSRPIRDSGVNQQEQQKLQQEQLQEQQKQQLQEQQQNQEQQLGDARDLQQQNVLQPDNIQERVNGLDSKPKREEEEYKADEYENDIEKPQQNNNQ